jgi:hypothetical protein
VEHAERTKGGTRCGQFFIVQGSHERYANTIGVSAVLVGVRSHGVVPVIGSVLTGVLAAILDVSLSFLTPAFAGVLMMVVALERKSTGNDGPRRHHRLSGEWSLLTSAVLILKI